MLCFPTLDTRNSGTFLRYRCAGDLVGLANGATVTLLLLLLCLCGILLRQSVTPVFGFEGPVFQQITANCPVCHTPVAANTIVKEQPSRGLDADGCMHGLGRGLDLYRTAICPRCLFAGMIEDFRADLSLSTALRDKILAGGIKIFPAKADEFPLPLLWGGLHVPDWIKYDIMAQILGYSEGNTMQRGRMILRVAWALRQSEVINVVPADFVERSVMFLRSRIWSRWDAFNAPSPAQDVNEALVLLGAAQKYQNDAEHGVRALSAFHLLTIHGEYTLASAGMWLFRQDLPTYQWVEMRQRLAAHVNLERLFLRRALGVLLLALQNTNEEPNADELFQIGDLYRRLEDYDSAERYLAQAEENSAELSIDFREWLPLVERLIQISRDQPFSPPLYLRNP